MDCIALRRCLIFMEAMSMDKEKILAYINIDLKKPVDKFSMKLFTGFYIGFSVFVFGFSALFRMVHFSFFHIAASVLCVLSLVFQLLAIRFCKNHAYEWLHHAFSVFSSILALLYGWLIFSKIELLEDGYPRFGWIHMAVLIAALVLGGYMVAKFCWVYKITKNNTVEEAKAMLDSRNKKHRWEAVALAVCPVLFVMLLEGSFFDVKLGMGFYAWALMCCWLVLGMMLLPKIVVIFKYKVYRGIYDCK